MINFDYQIYKLSDIFYDDYPETLYDELLKKNDRPYTCLLIETKYDYFICIPYRTEIHHKYAFKFKKSKRSKKHSSGLDYSKIVIIKNLSYINSKTSALIDKDEYTETMIHIRLIAKQANAYVDGYINHCTKKHLLPLKTFQRKYQYSTLKYFHKELGI